MATERIGHCLDQGREKELEDQWADILYAIELPSTRMILSQQAKLLELTADQAVVLVAENWIGIVQSRTDLLQAAIHKILPKKTPELVLKSDHSADTQVKGHFTDGLWADIDPREQELLAYGMRYGLTREEAEDVYEENSSCTRANIRWKMRVEAGHTERLPEGESIERKDEDDAPF